MYVTFNTEYLRKEFSHLFIYLTFLFISTAVFLNIASSFWITHVLEEEFLDDEFDTHDGASIILYEISKMEHLWVTLDNIFFESLYWNYWYKDYETSYKVMQDNLLLGTPRLRQLQVQKDSCDIPDHFEDFFKTCYASYTPATEFKQAFGLKNGSAWTYTDKADFHCVYYHGSAGTYGCDGYFQDLSAYAARTKKLVRNLRRNLWVSRQSRALIIDMNIYNGNLNAVAILKIVFELPATGGIVASSKIETVKLVPYATTYDYFVLALELIYVAFLVYYTREIVKHIKKWRLDYLKVIWNCVDMFIIFMGFGFLLLRFYIIYLACVALDKVFENPERYISFDRLGYWYSHLNIWTGLMFVVMWMKVFKYLKLNKTLGQITDTFATSAYNVGGFMITFWIIFAAYGQLGYLLFGENIYMYSSFSKSMFTLLKMLHGEIDYDEMARANYVLAPIFFCTFIFFIYFLLLNMFLAIINNAYTMVKSKLSNDSLPSTGTFIKRGATRIFAKCKRIQKHFTDRATNVYKMTNVKTILRLAKYTDTEVELLFSRYEFGHNQDISDADMTAFLQELQQNRRHFHEAADYVRSRHAPPAFMTASDLDKQRVQIDTLEQNIGKLDGILNEILQGERRIKASKLNI